MNPQQQISPVPTGSNTPLSQPPPSPQMKPAKKEGGIISFLITLFIAFILVQMINIFLFQSYKVFGSSMYPTLHDGDRLIISKVGKTAASIMRHDYQPERGDVIVFTNPRQKDIQLIKRVVGLPGDRVVVENGTITVYNQENPDGFKPDDAPYGKDLPATTGKADITVPENHVFVSGDNRIGSNSLDSRNELGTVPEENIIGTLAVRLWPFDSARFF